MLFFKGSVRVKSWQNVLWIEAYTILDMHFIVVDLYLNVLIINEMCH